MLINVHVLDNKDILGHTMVRTLEPPAPKKNLSSPWLEGLAYNWEVE